MRLGVKVTGVKTDNKIITAVKTNTVNDRGQNFIYYFFSNYSKDI